MNLMKNAYDSDEDHMTEPGDISRSGSTNAAEKTDGPGIYPAAVAAAEMVTGVDAVQLRNTGANDDPDWVKPDVGELVVGERGIDWVDDYSTRLGSRVYRRLVRRDRMRPSEVGTVESAAKICLDLALRPGGVRILEDCSGFRILSFPRPDDSR
jgi:hypothetical protein